MQLTGMRLQVCQSVPDSPGMAKWQDWESTLLTRDPWRREYRMAAYTHCTPVNECTRYNECSPPDLERGPFSTIMCREMKVFVPLFSEKKKGERVVLFPGSGGSVVAVKKVQQDGDCLRGGKRGEGARDVSGGVIVMYVEW